MFDDFWILLDYFNHKRFFLGSANRSYHSYDLSGTLKLYRRALLNPGKQSFHQQPDYFTGIDDLIGVIVIVEAQNDVAQSIDSSLHVAVPELVVFHEFGDHLRGLDVLIYLKCFLAEIRVYMG